MKNKTPLSLLALCLGYFMVIIDVTIINVALPSMTQDLNGGITGLQWIVDGYTLTFAFLWIEQRAAATIAVINSVLSLARRHILLLGCTRL